MDELAIAEVLERAADLIVVDGWMQGSWGSPGGPRCAEGHLHGAVNERLGEQQLPGPFCNIYWDVIDVLIRQSGRELTGWNDQNGRTAGEVRDLFLSTAKDIRNETRDGVSQTERPIP